MKCLVTGAGGFVGGHLVKRLLEEGHQVQAVDIKLKLQWHQQHAGIRRVDFHAGQGWDLRNFDACLQACRGVDEVYNLAADMGGMGFIETHKLDCMRSVLINTHMLEAAHRHGVSKYFFSSSACVYPGYVQNNEMAKKGKGLKESDAYPADPEDGYGWEKLFSERMCQHYYEERNQEVRVGRYHNVFGHMGTWTGGREKAPAAVCRKVALAAITGQYEIEIWGDGEQTRSFMYIDDCIEGTMRLMNSDIREPINIGSSELVSINQLVTVVEEIAGVKLERKYNLSAPQGVRGRNSDNTKIKELLDWEPSIKLSDGLERTYSWIHDQVMAERTK